MPRGKDWVDLVRSTFHSVGKDEMSGLYAREWKNAKDKLTADDREAIEKEPKRWKRFFKTANSVLFGLSRRLAPARRVVFGAALLLIVLAFNWRMSSHTETTSHGKRRTSEYAMYFDNGLLI